MDISQMFFPTTPDMGVPSQRLVAVRNASVVDQVKVAAANVTDALLNSVRTNAVALFRNTSAGQGVEREATNQYVQELLGSPALLIGVVAVVGFLLLRRGR